jgi:integron integrase
MNGWDPRGGKLLDQLRHALELGHYSPTTADADVGWARRFILFHRKRHPRTMGPGEVTAFLSSLVSDRAVSASTQNQALAALLFLYGHVLGVALGPLPEVAHARRPARLPAVMTREEAAAVLSKLDGTPKLMASLLYGSGLRLLECARLRIKDVDFGATQLVVRRGKGQRDRVTLLPRTLIPALQAHLAEVRRQYDRDVAAGAGFVELPHALSVKYPQAPREWPWQWVFPATRLYLHRPTGEHRRHHLHETVLPRAVRQAVSPLDLVVRP